MSHSWFGVGWCGGSAGLLLQQAFKRIQPACPEVLVLTQPLLGAGQWAGVQAAQVGAAAHLALDQPGALQRLDVPGRGRQRDGKRFGQLAYRLLAASQASQHLAARGVAQRVVCGVQLGVFLIQP